jgi:hypothetical protein
MTTRQTVSRVSGLIIIAAVLGACFAPAVRAQVPADSTLVLKEAENGFNGTWTFDGNDGKGVWESHYGRPPNMADLTLLKFDGQCIEVRRVDRTGGIPGLTADYHSCTITGHHIEGDATWNVPGRASTAGKWRADFEIITPDEAYRRATAALAGPDKAAARRWLGIAAAHGNMGAAYQLGALLHDGIGGPKDLPAARALFEQGAKAGRGDAAYALARMMESGEAGPVDVAGARKLYEQSLVAHFGPALPRLVSFEEAEYVPNLTAVSPAWQVDDRTMRDGVTAVHTLATQIVDGQTRFVLAAQCETQGISAAKGVSFSLWLLSTQQPPLHLASVKYRRQGARGNAGIPPAAQHYRPERWTLMMLPADTDETLLQYANQARWQDTLSRMSVGFGMGGDFAIGLQGSPLSPDQQADAAHILAAQRMLRLYQLVFQQRAAGSGPEDRDILQVEVFYAPDGDRTDQMAQTHKILKFDLTDMDVRRHSFLEDQCQMTDPYADPAVRNEQPDTP